jgi:hypothetical protein
VKSDTIQIVDKSPAKITPLTIGGGGEMDAAARYLEGRRLEEEAAAASLASTEQFAADSSVIIEALEAAAVADVTAVAGVAAVPVGGDGEVVAAIGSDIKGEHNSFSYRLTQNNPTLLGKDKNPLIALKGV